MPANDSRPQSASNARKRISALRFATIQAVIVGAIVLLAEAGLMLAGIAPLKALDPVAEDDSRWAYPGNPGQYLKIAVFGGSAAQGAFVPRAFDEVLQYELMQRYPDQQFFVRNYAMHGFPFHRHQAEWAKMLIDKYDVLVIYCGNNEAENWYDDSGYWRQPEFADAKDLEFAPPPDATMPVLTKARTWLASNSRIYAYVTRKKERVGSTVYKNRNHDYKEFEPADSLPPEQRAAIVSNFEQDVRDLSELAAEHDAQILLSVTAPFETWPPSYSTFRPDILDEEKQRWMELFEQGNQLREAGQLEQAILAYQKAAEIDGDVSVLNYRMGLICLEQGQEQARRYLRKAIDHEGHYFRSPSSLHETAKRLAEQHNRLHYVDVVGAFHHALEDGSLRDEDLFVDVYHPSFLGHVIMARTFLDSLSQLAPVAEWQAQDVPENVPVDWKALTAERYRDLDIQPTEAAAAMAENVLWYFDMAHFCAYPHRCYAEVRTLLERIHQLCGDGDPMFETFAAVTRARLAIRDGDHAAAAQFANEALAHSPKHLRMILEMKAWNHYLGDEFEEAGIRYDSSAKQYVVGDKV